MRSGRALLSLCLLKRKGEVIAARLQTPNKFRDLQRRLYLKAKREPVWASLVCLAVKMIGKPYSGECAVEDSWLAGERPAPGISFSPG